MKNLIIALIAVLYGAGSHAQEGLLTFKQLESQPYYMGMEEALQNPAGVRKLDLALTKSAQLPADLAALPNLQILSLSGSSRNIDWKGGIEILKKVPNLQYLFFFDSGMTVIPAEIFSLTDLLGFGVSASLVSTLPPAIGQLNKLQYLFLDDNNLKTLPPEIAQLKDLQMLMLDENPIAVLPTQMSQMKKLKELTLVDTKVSREEIMKLQKSLPQVDVVTPRDE